MMLGAAVGAGNHGGRQVLNGKNAAPINSQFNAFAKVFSAIF
jgi:hypothetical protein